MERPTIKSPTELEYMREAGLVVAAIHRALIDATKPGVTTAQLDEVVAKVVADAGAKPNFLHYQGFPATVCISVNDEVVHGIPGQRALQLGDIVSYDCGAYVVRAGKKWHGDAAVTVVVGDTHIPDAQFVQGIHPEGEVGGVSPVTLSRRRTLSSVTRGSMWAGIAAAAKAKRTNDVAAAIESAPTCMKTRRSTTIGPGVGAASWSPGWRFVLSRWLLQGTRPRPSSMTSGLLSQSRVLMPLTGNTPWRSVNMEFPC